MPPPRELPAGLEPYFPLVYLIWEDGHLTAAEIQAVLDELSQAGELPEESRGRLEAWLAPDRPPAPEELQALRRAARDTVSSGEAETSLARIERALGMPPSEILRRLDPGRPHPSLSPSQEAPAAFAPDRLQALLDAPYGAVRARLRTLLAGPGFRLEESTDRESHRERVLGWCRELAQQGFGRLSYPAAVGGGDSPGESIATFETLAGHDLSLLVKFGVQFGLFGGSLLQLGTERHHRAYLPEVGNLDLPGCFAMSETGHGSNVAEIRTVARYDAVRGDFEIHTPDEAARKDWIGNAARHGRMATVFAQLEVGGERYGVHAFVVPIRQTDGSPAPGVTIEDCGGKAGLNGVDNGRLTFHHVRVPRENLLDRFAAVSPDGVYSSPIPGTARRFFTMLGTLVAGRVSVSLAAVTAAKAGLTIAVRYGSRRRQFGPPGGAEVAILDYPSHQRRLLPRLAAAYALDFAGKSLVRQYLAGLAHPDGMPREVESFAAGLKAYSSWQTVDTLQTCRECCGGQGYLSINRLPQLRDDADIFTTFEGDNTVLYQLVAKSLLTGYRSQFENLDLWLGLRFVARRAAGFLSDLDPLTPRNTREEHLRSPQFHREIFRYREEHLLTSVARRLKQRLDGGMDSFLAFNECQTHLLSLAKAHVERVVIEEFHGAVETVEDPDLRGILQLLYEIFALWRIEADAAWFLSAGQLEGDKAAAIRKCVDRLCGEARRQALPLVAAFGFQEELLPPIAG